MLSSQVIPGTRVSKHSKGRIRPLSKEDKKRADRARIRAVQASKSRTEDEKSEASGRSWDEIRAEAVESGRLNEKLVEEERARLRAIQKAEANADR